MLATDLADYLVGKGVPFREAHGVMRRLCRHCEAEGAGLSELPLAQYQAFSPHFDDDVYAITAVASVAARDNPGGTAPNRVAEGLRRAKGILAKADPR
jgi:argininosuccinate lyase